MQWLQFLFWGALTLWASRDPRRARIWAYVLCAGLLISMATQMWLLWEIGQFSVSTAVPLHLCSIMGVLSIPMLLTRSKILYAAALLLGAPCALLALLFPAIAESARPQLMASSFFRLHVLIFWAPVLLMLRGFPLSLDPRPVLLAGVGYMALVALFNLLFHTNYLFLRLAPAGTPLEWMAEGGPVAYVASFVMIGMVVSSVLSWGYGRMRLMVVRFCRV